MIPQEMSLLEALGRWMASGASAEQRARWESLVAEAFHPMRARGVVVDPAVADALGRTYLGGAGGVFAAGSSESLGPVRALQEARFHVTTATAVRVELWMPFARHACGEWVIQGPGTTTLLMRETRSMPGMPRLEASDIGIVTVTGVHGTFPAWITFGP